MPGFALLELSPPYREHLHIVNALREFSLKFAREDRCDELCRQVCMGEEFMDEPAELDIFVRSNRKALKLKLVQRMRDGELGCQWDHIRCPLRW